MAQNFGLADYGGLGFVNRIRRARTPQPQTFSRQAMPLTGRTAAPVPQGPGPSDYGMTSGAGTVAGLPRQFGNVALPTPTPPRIPGGYPVLPGAGAAPSAVTPGLGNYAGVGPGDPAGYLSAPYGSEYPFGSLQDLSRYLIRGGGQEGVFQPDYLRRLMRNRALANAAAQRSRGGLIGMLAGFDPYQQREALLSGDIAAGSDLTNALNEAELMGGTDYQNFIRSLLSTERGGESNLFTSRDLLQRQLDAQGGGIGDFLGNVAGTALGSFAGGYGGSLGKSLGAGRMSH